MTRQGFPEKAEARVAEVNPYASPQTISREPNPEPARVPETYPWIATLIYGVLVGLIFWGSTHSLERITPFQWLFLAVVFGFPWLLAPLLAFCFQFLRRRGRTFLDAMWSYLNILLICLITVHTFGVVLGLLSTLRR